jgi:hypothetical protein
MKITTDYYGVKTIVEIPDDSTSNDVLKAMCNLMFMMGFGEETINESLIYLTDDNSN